MEHIPQPTSPSIASEKGLTASAAVSSASINADVVTRGTGVSPSSLPSLSLLAPAFADQAANGDGHEHPAVQPTSCKSSVNLIFIY
jgi:hypothetical protein